MVYALPQPGEVSRIPLALLCTPRVLCCTLIDPHCIYFHAYSHSPFFFAHTPNVKLWAIFILKLQRKRQRKLNHPTEV